MKRAATLVLVMLAMSASAAVDVREGQKTQWAPTRNFSSLNARAVFAGESRGATSPYAGEEWETAAGEKDWQYAAGNPMRFVDPSGRSNECGSEGGAAGPGNDVTGNQSGALRRESCTSPGGGPLVASTAAIDERHAGYQRAIDEEAARVNAAAGPVAATVVQTGGTFGGGVFFGIPRAVTAPDQMAEAVVGIPGRLIRAGAECDVSNPDPVKCSQFAGVAGETLSVPLGMAGPNPKGNFVDISLDPRLALRGAGELVDACVSKMPLVVPELLPATAVVPGTAPICVRPGFRTSPAMPSQLPFVTMAKPGSLDDATSRWEGEGGRVGPRRQTYNFKKPSARHQLSSVTQGTLTKEHNTVIETGVNLLPDIELINDGLALKVGDRFIVNGRTYGYHDNVLFPIEGPGFRPLNRGAFQALGILNKFGDTAQSRAIISRMKNVGPAELEAALSAWQVGR